MFLDEAYSPITSPVDLPGRKTVFLEVRVNSSESQIVPDVIYERNGQVISSTPAVLDRVSEIDRNGQGVYLGRIELEIDLDTGVPSESPGGPKLNSTTAIGVGTAGVLLPHLGPIELSRLEFFSDVKLCIFLDANRDNTYSPYQTVQLSSLDDMPQYLPCSDPDTRMGVNPGSLPQAMDIVAAFAVVSGDQITIVRPSSSISSVQFELKNVSAFEGAASNWGSSTDPDFVLWDGTSTTTLISVPFDATSFVAKAELQCSDYGGFGEIQVSAAAFSASTRIPENDESSLLPEHGWVTTTGTVITNYGLAAESDEDSTPAVAGPPANGLVGDGLSNYEEYRGFIVREEHRRTNPFKKDLFVSSNAYTNIAFLPNIPLTVHRIWGEDNEPANTREYGPDRQINHNYNNHGFGGAIPGWSLQRAIRGIEVATSPTTPPCSPGCYGYSFYISGGPANPNDSERFEIYRDSHQLLLSLMPPYTQQQADNEFRRSFGHEAGHLVHICHRIGGAPSGCPDGATVGTNDSVMSSDEFGGPDASDPASQYNSADIDQIRLHENP